MSQAGREDPQEMWECRQKLPSASVITVKKSVLPLLRYRRLLKETEEEVGEKLQERLGGANLPHSGCPRAVPSTLVT